MRTPGKPGFFIYSGYEIGELNSNKNIRPVNYSFNTGDSCLAGDYFN